jgi:transposase InsO family protein
MRRNPRHRERRAIRARSGQRDRSRYDYVAREATHRNRRRRVERLVAAQLPGLQLLALAVVEYISWFNHHRLHESLDDIPPAELEALYATRYVPTPSLNQ